MRIFLAGTVLVASFGLGACAATANAAESTEFDAEKMLSAAALRDGIRGDQFTYRAIQHSAASAKAFAEGYVAALATVAAREGKWCDTGIAPHEVVARVFDHIEGLGDEAANRAADAAVMDTLQGLAPCNENEVSQ